MPAPPRAATPLRYFAMKEAGPHFVRVDNIISPEKLIVQLQIDRVKFLKQISPSGLLSAGDRSAPDLGCRREDLPGWSKTSRP